MALSKILEEEIVRMMSSWSMIANDAIAVGWLSPLVDRGAKSLKRLRRFLRWIQEDDSPIGVVPSS
jgi:hypothetical protein